TDLRGHELVGYDETMARVPGALWLAEHGEGATVVLRGNSLAAATNATLVGMGPSVLPGLLVEPKAQLRRLTPEVPGTRELHLLVHPDLARVARVRTVLDFLVEILQRERATLTGCPD